MDYAKVADIVCPVLSVLDVDLAKYKADPHAYGGAFDEVGLSTISILRSVGLGTTIPIIQDLDKLSGGKKREVKDLFQLFMTSEFSENAKVVTLEEESDLMKLMLAFKNSAPIKLDEREERGSFLVEGISIAEDGQHVDLWGVVKGDGFGASEHVHLTGFGDLELVGIGAAFSSLSLEEGRREREERAEEMLIEGHHRPDKKKLARRRKDFSVFKAATNIESFELKSPNFDPNKMVGEEIGEEKMDSEMKKLIEGFKDMGIGKEAPKDTDEIEDEIEAQDDGEDNMSYEEYEQSLRPIKYSILIQKPGHYSPGTGPLT